MNDTTRTTDRPLIWDRQNPDRLMGIFTATPALKWLAVSVAVHLLLLGITSLGYIRDRWIDPEGARERAAAKEVTDTARAEDAEADTVVLDAPAAAALPVAQGPVTEAQLLEDRHRAPVVQRITETAAPLDIPSQPDDLGLSLEDTRR